MYWWGRKAWFLQVGSGEPVRWQVKSVVITSCFDTVLQSDFQLEAIVTSDKCEVAISATWVNDVIIQTAIEAHSERWTWFTQTAFVCLGQNSLSGYCQVSSRSPAIALPYKPMYAKHLSVFLGIPAEKGVLCIIKCHSGESRAHLAVSTAQASFVCLCKLISPLLWASMAARTISHSRCINCYVHH